MVTHLNQQALYEMADTLDMVLKLNALNDVVGTSQHKVLLNDSPVFVHMEVVSSLITPKGVGVLCRVMGNVAMLVLTGFDQSVRASVLLLDLAKLRTSPDDLIENENLTELVQVTQFLKPAVVQVFHKLPDRQWQTGKLPA